jgi:Domain of unknown function (DUF4326)
MHHPKVLNKRNTKYAPDAIYVGRPTKWGNPFVIGKDGDREHVIKLYYEWLMTEGPIDDIEELRGKDLICWCAPQACHADILLERANE